SFEIEYDQRVSCTGPIDVDMHSCTRNELIPNTSLVEKYTTRGSTGSRSTARSSVSVPRKFVSIVARGRDRTALTPTMAARWMTLSTSSTARATWSASSTLPTTILTLPLQLGLLSAQLEPSSLRSKLPASFSAP